MKTTNNFTSFSQRSVHQFVPSIFYKPEKTREIHADNDSDEARIHWSNELVNNSSMKNLVSLLVYRSNYDLEFHPSFVFDLCKQIDGMSSATGTFLITARRVRMYLDQRDRQIFYEPILDVSSIRSLIGMNQYLYYGGVPHSALIQIQISFHAFRSIFSAEDGRVPLPDDGDDCVGEHAVVLNSIWDEETESAHFTNTWGHDWGDHGSGWLSLEYLDRYFVEGWATRSAAVGISRFTYEQLANATSPEERAALWMKRNPRWRRRILLFESRCQLVLYETVSLESIPVQIFEVRTGYGLRIAWAHLYLAIQPSRVATIKELYVWPAFRRRGFGSLLEQAMVANARDWGAERLQILIYDTDAQPIAKESAESFAKQAGYDWMVPDRLPQRVAAVLEKQL